MNDSEYLTYIYSLIFSLIALFFILFTISSNKEKKIRPALISLLSLLITAAAWFGADYCFEANTIVRLVFIGIVVITALLFFLPFGRKQLPDYSNPAEKADERDTMFARAKYREGTEIYNEYYEMHPELKKIDDKIRRLPNILEPGGKFYDPIKSEYVKSLFDIEEKNINFVDGPVNPEKTHASPEVISNILKKYTIHLGADEVGIAKLNPYWLYSHAGIGPEPWGSKIENNHTFAIAYTLVMNYKNVEKAPHIEITEETANQYLNAQKISISIAQYIRNLGYSARAHISGSNYQAMLPPVAYDAGLGELSRMGYLISKKFGARVRLGLVTTDMPLIADKPVSFGVNEFCEICKKCAVNCPSGSIPKNGKVNVRGIEKWMIDIEKCYQYWRICGTDCGLCMKVCPFSHPDTLIHKILKTGIKNSSFARYICNLGDNIFYGKK